MKISRSFKLSAYASLSGYFLSGFQSSEAQVVYIDIDPDMIIDEPGSSQELDMDGNGIADFSFLFSSFTFYSPGHNSYRNRIDILVKPLNSLNALAGTSDYHGTFSGGAWWYYPYALAYNSKIGASDLWQTNDEQILALVTIDSDDGIVHYAPDADWFNSNIEETIDHYLGVRFIDSENMSHYGWVRCDVIDSGKTLILKDYGFNNFPENGIYAGTLITTILSEEENMNWNIFAVNNTLYINTQMSLDKVTYLNVFNSAGSLVFNSLLTETNFSVNLEGYALGIYVVEVKSESSKIHKKIVIN